MKVEIPATLSPEIYIKYIKKGLTFPNVLHIEIYANTQKKIKKLIQKNIPLWFGNTTKKLLMGV